jgi:hypothetical protein
MDRRCNYLIVGLAGFVILLSAHFPAWAKDHHAVSTAPGFQLSQVDTLCVLPLIDARYDAWAGGPGDVWSAVVWELQEKGYRVADPSCSTDAGANGAQSRKWRWTLTLRLEGDPGGRAAYILSASLVDGESGKEVWRGGSVPLFMGNAGSGSWVMISNGVGPLLSNFEKRKNPSPPSIDNMWKPVSLQTRLYKIHTFTECNGLLRLDSGTLTFEPSDNGTHEDKCASFRFSVPGAKVKTGRWMLVPGKGRFFLQNPGNPLDESWTKDRYLYLALRSLR